MKVVSRIVQVTIMLAAVVFLAGHLGAAEKKSYKIGAAVYGTRGEFVQMWVKAIMKHPAVQSGLANVTVFDGQYDALVQSNQFDTMITQKFDAIIVVAIDYEAGGDLVAKAKKANIPVVASNVLVHSDDIVSYVGSADVQAGEMEADWVIKKMGGKGNVVIIEGPIGQSAQIQRGEGNKNAIDKNSGVKVIAQRTANWSRAEALALMQNWITAYPNQINGVIGQNDEMALGAIEAMKAAGLDPKKIPVAGIDGVTDAINAVKRGEMMSILQDASAQAQGALDVALRHLVGDSYKPMSDCWTMYPDMKWEDGQLKRYDVPWTIVTLENADKLLEMREKLMK